MGSSVSQTTNTGVYGAPPADLVDVADKAVQFSPLLPGSAALEAARPASFDGMVLLAPPGTLERRAIIALALKALKPDAPLTVLALKDKGGLRIAKELKAFGCDVGEDSRKHFRICQTLRPESFDREAREAIATAIAEGGPRRDEALGLWTQPGVFSWDRLDPGSALLIEHLPKLSGKVADLGCGIGALSIAVLAASPKVESIAMVDIDRRAVEAARQNVTDPRATVQWADVRGGQSLPQKLDFVVMNPPFHDGGTEDKALGQGFIRQAADMLKPGGFLWLTANRHLPYEEVLKPIFKLVTLKAESGGYKIFEARK